MNKQTNVLVYPCGAESGLEIHLALKDVMNIKIVGASGKEDHGRMVYKNYYSNFPLITESNFIEELNALISKEEIDLILPTHDTILLYMSKNSHLINAKIASPGIRQAEICRSKKKIYDLFSKYDFCPKVFKTMPSESELPVYAKLDEGQGSKGAFIVNEMNQIAQLKDPENYVITEYLPGEELTIDCFTDRNGVVKFVGPRKRLRVFDGVCVNSEAVEATKEINEIAKIVSDEIGVRGAWYFQLKKDINEKFKLLEASTKIAGNMNVFRGIGVNFPLLMVYDYLDYDVKVFHNDYKISVDRALFSRYTLDLEFDTVYIDFDDTITKNDGINVFIMQFLYHLKNRKKIIKLITKHQQDLLKSLHDLAIHPSLFDEIIHLKMEDEKYKYITEKEKVIFIDNAYGERAKIKHHLNIPVFDVDAVSTLIDYRE